MATWNSIYNLLPSDGQYVWIRPNDFYDDPIIAIFSLSGSSFTSLDTGIEVPAWNVYRWKGGVMLGVGSMAIGSNFVIS